MLGVLRYDLPCIKSIRQPVSRRHSYPEARRRNRDWGIREAASNRAARYVESRRRASHSISRSECSGGFDYTSLPERFQFEVSESTTDLIHQNGLFDSAQDSAESPEIAEEKAVLTIISWPRAIACPSCHGPREPQNHRAIYFLRDTTFAKQGKIISHRPAASGGAIRDTGMQAAERLVSLAHRLHQHSSHPMKPAEHTVMRGGSQRLHTTHVPNPSRTPPAKCARPGPRMHGGPPAHKLPLQLQSAPACRSPCTDTPHVSQPNGYTTLA